MAWRKFFY